MFAGKVTYIGTVSAQPLSFIPEPASSRALDLRLSLLSFSQRRYPTNMSHLCTLVLRDKMGLMLLHAVREAAVRGLLRRCDENQLGHIDHSFTSPELFLTMRLQKLIPRLQLLKSMGLQSLTST